MNLRAGMCAVALSVSLAYQTSAHALATIETIVTATSLAVSPATAVVGGVAVGGAGAAVKIGATSWWGDLVGTLLVVGGIAIVVVDPPSATFYSGSWTLHYPGELLKTVDSGWLGDWGDKPSDAAPPADPLGFPAGAEFVVHAASPGLTASTVDDPAGLQTTTFDWGPAGHAVEGTGPFNLFATLLEARETVTLHYLGTSSAVSPVARTAPPLGANLYITSPGVSCSLPGSEVIINCGEPETQYFSVRSVPEPATWLAMIAGIGAAAVGMRRSGRRIQPGQ